MKAEDVGDGDSLLAWLDGRPRELCILVAARAALRVLPLFSGFAAAAKGPRAFADQNANLFRACASARAEALYPGHGHELAVVADAASGVAQSARAAVASAAHAAAAAAGAARAAYDDSVFATLMATVNAACAVDPAAVAARDALALASVRRDRKRPKRRAPARRPVHGASPMAAIQRRSLP